MLKATLTPRLHLQEKMFITETQMEMNIVRGKGKQWKTSVNIEIISLRKYTHMDHCLIPTVPWHKVIDFVLKRLFLKGIVATY